MERLVNGARKNIFSDPSHRMPHRPAAIKPGEGQGFLNLGASFASPKSQVKYGKTYKSKLKPSAAQQHTQRRAPSRVSDDDSDDELLLSSQNSMDADASWPSKRVGNGKKSTNPFHNVETVRVGDRDLPAHPDFQPSTLNAVKGLRFKKNKKASPAIDSVAEGPPQSSSLDDSQGMFKPISDDIEIIDSPPPHPSSRQRPSEASSTRKSGRSVAHSPVGRIRDRKPEQSSLPVRETPRLPTMPRPRPCVATTQKPPHTSPESTPRPRPRPRTAQQKRDLPLRSKSPELTVTADKKQPVKKPSGTSLARREPQEFPMTLQARENVSDGAWGDTSSAKTKKNAISRSTPPVHAANVPKPMPLPSPLGTRQISHVSTFPKLLPLSFSNDKGKARAESSDEDDVNLTEGTTTLGGIKPFPMSSQMLKSIDKQANSVFNVGFTKRTSSDDSGAKDERSPVKYRDSCWRVIDMFSHLDEPMEEDSIDLGCARDPSKMCPYCDEDLPSHPTPLLQHLLVTARKKSAVDPRPRNRAGLRAPLAVYISVCQRHRFESCQLPIAEEKGWPKTIDFNQVPARVKRMKSELEAIILDKDDASDAEEIESNRGPRNKSIFWGEVKKEVKKQGSRAVAGVKGQFMSFEKAQPGYYGEQGSVVIHQTLFNLFPPSMFDASLIAPLTPAEFIQRILVPETAVRLIAQDLGLAIEDAVVTLRESAQYGVAMFPDANDTKRKGTDADDDDEMNVADRIVMERARARRKELAEEEKVEKEMMDEERAAQRAMAREIRRKKAIERAQQAKRSRQEREDSAREEVGTSDPEEASLQHEIHRRTKQRPGRGGSETDAMSVDGEKNKHLMRDGNKGIRARDTPQLNNSVSDTDSMGLFGSPKFKTSGIKERKKPLGDFGWLDSGEEQGSTPRPLVTGRRVADADAAKVVTGNLLPLQITRNRPGANAVVRDPYSANMKDFNADSDASSANYSLDRPPIRKGRPLAPWPMSNASSSDHSD